MMRAAGIACLAALMAAPPVWADDLAPLAPGRPAGIHDAQLDRASIFLAAGGVTLVAGFAVLFSGGLKDSVALKLDGGSGVVAVSNSNAPTGTQ